MSSENINNASLSTKYQKKTDIEHILTVPDTYIGSIEKVDSDMWILNDEGTKIIEKNIKAVLNCTPEFLNKFVNKDIEYMRITLGDSRHPENIEAMEAFNVSSFNYFWHEEDDFTLTSKGFIWSYPKKYNNLYEGKKQVILDFSKTPQINEDCYGICLDYIIS